MSILAILCCSCFVVHVSYLYYYILMGKELMHRGCYNGTLTSSNLNFQNVLRLSKYSASRTKRMTDAVLYFDFITFLWNVSSVSMKTTKLTIVLVTTHSRHHRWGRICSPFANTWYHHWYSEWWVHSQWSQNVLDTLCVMDWSPGVAVLM